MHAPIIRCAVSPACTRCIWPNTARRRWRCTAPCWRARGIEEVRPGRLVSLRDVQFFEEYVDHLDGHLDVHAECLYADDGGAQYVFRVEHRGRLLASGRAAVIHPVI